MNGTACSPENAGPRTGAFVLALDEHQKLVDALEHLIRLRVDRQSQVAVLEHLALERFDPFGTYAFARRQPDAGDEQDAEHQQRNAAPRNGSRDPGEARRTSRRARVVDGHGHAIWRPSADAGWGSHPDRMHRGPRRNGVGGLVSVGARPTTSLTISLADATEVLPACV